MRRPPVDPDLAMRLECQAVWRCAIGDAVGAVDVLKNKWANSRRKHEREAAKELDAVALLIWAAREPAAGCYDEANANGRALIERVRAALKSLAEKG